MSHFAGLVILTPEYIKNHFEPLEEALEKYNENTEVPEYSKGAVSDFEKIRFVTYYKNDKTFEKKSIEAFYYYAILKGLVEPYNEENPQRDAQERCAYRCMHDNEEEYVKFILSIFPEFLNGFKELYEEKGEDWNANTWRVSPTSGKWEEYSTYNPDSVYDWYELGGRWDSSIKTKDNEFVNECFLEEIDWTDFSPDDYEDEEKEDWDGTKYKPLKDGVKWHFTKNSVPYCLFINGEHTSRGKMGWWGMSSDEKENWNEEFFEIISRLPEKSEVYLIDFHI